jgi:cell cycle arrest protein BUB3
MATSQQYELASPPNDGITNVTFCPNTPLLLASSWDTSVRVYDVANNIVRTQYRHKAAALDCTFPDKTRAFSGGLDRAVKMFEVNTNTEFILGEHEKAVRCVEFSTPHEMLISGSWDATIKSWDPRVRQCTGTFAVPAKVFSMCLAGDRLVVGTSGRSVNVYDLRNMTTPEQRRESSLKFQTRCIRAFIDNTGYALSSVEGRVAMEYFDPSPEVQAKKYAFKCHRKTTAGVDTVYPVNAMSFHPVFGTFATGGCDGLVNIWDGQNKKRLCQFASYPTSISSLSFDSTGTLLAVASSYTYEEGERDHPQDAIFIRHIAEAEVKQKQR